MANRNVTENTTNRRHPVLVILIITIVFLTMATAVLFPFARDAYAAKRELDMSDEKVEAGDSYYHEVERKLKEIKTTEAIEDQAHGLNLAYPDEKSVDVSGLEDP